MKRIYFVRHATAIEKTRDVPDFERPLTKRGEKEAKVMARHLAHRYPVPDLIISSIANRAIETAHLMARTLAYPSQKILLRDTFYEYTATGVLAQEIASQPDNYRSLMIIGHDPSLSRLTAYLVRGFRETIPKAGAVVANFATDRWLDLKGGSGRLLEFADPDGLKEERKLLKLGIVPCKIELGISRRQTSAKV